MNTHKYKEGLIFEIKSLDGIDNRLYLDNSDYIISKLYIGDKVKLLYSHNKNDKLEYELRLVNYNDTRKDVLIDGKELCSDFMTEDNVEVMIGKYIKNIN